MPDNRVQWESKPKKESNSTTQHGSVEDFGCPQAENESQGHDTEEVKGCLPVVDKQALVLSVRRHIMYVKSVGNYEKRHVYLW